MLLSDRDLKAELAAGGLGLDPYDERLVQPSSIDVRLDRYFRVFANHRYTHIDPAVAQDELTEMVEPDGEEPFVLHPGEFVLGSTLEVITLGDHLASRLEGKALALFTEVPTPQGWRTMADLQVGDEVFDTDGRPTRVVAATDVMDRRPCYAVELSDGSRFVADAAHQWVTRTKGERSRGLPARARTTQEMACTLRAGREWNHHVPLAGPAQYPAAELDVDPAELGALLVDTPPPGALPTVPAASATAAATPPSAPGALPTVPAASATAAATPPDDVWHAARRAATGSVAQRQALLAGMLDAAGDTDRSGRPGLVTECERLAELVVEVAASLGLRPVVGKASGRRRGVEAALHEVRWPAAGQSARRGLRLPVGRASRSRAVVAVRPTASVPVRCIEVAADSGTFLVGRTYVPTHNSSLGRLGLLTHSTAGFIDPGFSGHVTLELSNVANLPIKLYPGMKIGQVCVFRLTSPAENPYGSEVYGSRYQGQRGPTPSRSHLRFSRASTLPPG